MNSNSFLHDKRNEPYALPLNVPQFFFTDELISYYERVARRWMEARIDPEPVLKPEFPWEDRMLNLFGTVLPRPDGTYAMYYSNLIHRPFQSQLYNRQDLLLALSDDGVVWRKPKLGLIEWDGDGDRNNNLVFCKRDAFQTDSPSLAYDAEDEHYPYKLIFPERMHVTPESRGEFYMVGYRSKDGLIWEPTGTRIPGGDRTNMMSGKVNGQFEIYGRCWHMDETYGKRCIFRFVSRDFVHWSDPEPVLAPDLDDGEDVEFYGMSVFHRHGWYIGLLEYWHSSIDRFDIHLAVSRDGKSWLRPNRTAPFIKPEYDWNRKWNNIASNGCIIVNEQMVFHIGARRVGHNYDSVHKDGVVGVATVPLDRLCAIEGKAEGFFVTVPLLWPGGDLRINLDPRESYESHNGIWNGRCAVDVLNADGELLPDWSGADQAVFAVNTHTRRWISEKPVRWPGDRSLHAFAGKPIRLRFHLRHARLFTIEASLAGK